MKHTRAHGLGLALVTLLSLALTGWVLLALPAPADGPRRRGRAAAQEPPSLWDRAASAVQRREAVRLALPRLGVPAWHRAGRRGAGVKVAVLDSGLQGYTAALGKVLPARVTVRSFRKDGRLEARPSQHGVLCGEVIHHVAPDAELMFANWEPETPSSFLDAVRWARASGAKVISCSMIMPTWSDGEGGGPVHRALAEILGDAALFFASAGNTATRHWGGAVVAGKDGWHQWARGQADNAVRPLSADRVSVELVSPDAAEYELVVRDAAGGEVGRARSRGCAVVRFVPRLGQRYAVRLRQPEAKGKPGRFHLTVLGGRLQVATRQGSIPFPGDGASVVAVAAVDGKGRRQSYSSCGPGRVGDKPELSAVVPFPSVWRPGQPFAGTSAAAPQAAALAALLWSSRPGWSASQVREELCRAAGGEHSVESGFGPVRLPLKPPARTAAP